MCWVRVDIAHRGFTAPPRRVEQAARLATMTERHELLAKQQAEVQALVYTWNEKMAEFEAQAKVLRATCPNLHFISMVSRGFCPEHHWGDGCVHNWFRFL